MDIVRIVGSKGSFEVCANSGHVVSPYSAIPVDYRKYSSADLAEYRKWAARHQVDVGSEIPLLSVGMRRYDGRFEAPEKVYREELAYHQRNPQALVA